MSDAEQWVRKRAAAEESRKEKLENRIKTYDLQLKSYSRVPHRLTDEWLVASEEEEEEVKNVHTLAHANSQ